jgi:hypothetical protein
VRPFRHHNASHNITGASLVNLSAPVGFQQIAHLTTTHDSSNWVWPVVWRTQSPLLFHKQVTFVWCSNGAASNPSVPSFYLQATYGNTSSPAEKVLRCLEAVPQRAEYVIWHPEDFFVVAPVKWSKLLHSAIFLHHDHAFGVISFNTRGMVMTSFCKAHPHFCSRSPPTKKCEAQPLPHGCPHSTPDMVDGNAASRSEETARALNDAVYSYFSMPTPTPHFLKPAMCVTTTVQASLYRRSNLVAGWNSECGQKTEGFGHYVLEHCNGSSKRCEESTPEKPTAFGAFGQLALAFVDFAAPDTWNRVNAPQRGTAYPNMHSAVEGSPRARWNVENFPELCALLEHAASFDSKDDPPWLQVGLQRKLRLHSAAVCDNFPKPHFRPTASDPAGAAWIAAGMNRSSHLPLSSNGTRLGEHQSMETKPHMATWPWTCCVNS